MASANVSNAMRLTGAFLDRAVKSEQLIVTVKTQIRQLRDIQGYFFIK